MAVHHRKASLKGRPFGAALLSSLLGACSLAPFVAENSIDYNKTVEDVTLSVLITNVLRAKDSAPLFFSDLSLIRGNIALNLSTQDTIPFGPLYGSTARRSLQAGPLAANSTPGFDVAPLNTKQFYLGILNPINPNVLGYYLERGLPGDELLNLLVSRINEYRMTPGGPRAAGVISDDRQLGGRFADWRPRVRGPDEKYWQPFVRKARRVRAYGPPVRGSLGDVVKAATEAKVDVKASGDASQVYKVEEVPVLCVPDAQGRYSAVGIARNSIIDGPADTHVPEDNGACRSLGMGPAPIPEGASRFVISIRSVEAVFYYLGKQLQKPVEARQIKFLVEEGHSPDERISVEYRGRTYHVSGATGEDDTISILAVLSDLLNINRDASEIPSTKTVATAQ